MCIRDRGDGLVEIGRHAHRFLAGHGIGHEQRLDRLHTGLDVFDLAHHHLIDVEAAGRIEDNRRRAAGGGLLDAVGADRDRVGVRPFAIDGDIELLAQCLQLVDGRRAIDVGGDQERPPACLLYTSRCV